MAARSARPTNATLGSPLGRVAAASARSTGRCAQPRRCSCRWCFARDRGCEETGVSGCITCVHSIERSAGRPIPGQQGRGGARRASSCRSLHFGVNGLTMSALRWPKLMPTPSWADRSIAERAQAIESACRTAMQLLEGCPDREVRLARTDSVPASTRTHLQRLAAERRNA